MAQRSRALSNRAACPSTPLCIQRSDRPSGEEARPNRGSVAAPHPCGSPSPSAARCSPRSPRRRARAWRCLASNWLRLTGLRTTSSTLSARPAARRRRRPRDAGNGVDVHCQGQYFHEPAAVAGCVHGPDVPDRGRPVDATESDAIGSPTRLAPTPSPPSGENTPLGGCRLAGAQMARVCRLP